MRKIKSYQQFNEEINLKQLATGAALTAGLALGSPSKTVGQQVDPYNLTSSRLFPAEDTSKLSIPMSYVIQTSSDLTAKQLTSNFLVWVAKNFKSANNVIQLKDLDNSKVIIKCIFNSKWTALGGEDGSTHCTIEFKAKDGKYKVSFSDIYLAYTTGKAVYSYDFFKEKIASNKGFNIKASVRYINDVNNEIKNIVGSIENQLKSSNLDEVDDF